MVLLHKGRLSERRHHKPTPIAHQMFLSWVGLVTCLRFKCGLPKGSSLHMHKDVIYENQSPSWHRFPY